MTAPVIDRAVRRFLDVLNRAASTRSGPPTVAELRAGAVALAQFANPAPAVERAEDTLSVAGRQIRLRVYSPHGRGDETLPGLVYFHGGGLVAGDLDSHDAIVAAISDGAGCRMICVDYARAPEAKFPAAYEDACASTLAALAAPERFRLLPGRIGVGGDSAGGQLAALAARASSESGAPPKLQFLLCPVMDPLARTPSRFELAESYLIDEATMRVYWDAYRVEGLDARDPRVSPLGAADLTKLCPALIHVADNDPVRDEGEAYAQALKAAGVNVRLTRHAGLIHHFYGLGGVIPAAQSAFTAAIAELGEALAG